ncbi:MAG: response regulator [bacterium]
MNKVKILIVEDEADIRELIHFNLFKNGFDVCLASDGNNAIEQIDNEIPDLVILDLMLPKLGGLEVCQYVRNKQETKNVAILMLTARSSEEDIIKGFEAGADDYLTKPFSPKILMARVNAILRRMEIKNKDSETLLIENLLIDPKKCRVSYKNTPIDLTFSEFQILHFLAQKRGWVFTRSQIVGSLHGDNHAISDRAVDVQIVGLRKKLGLAGDMIETVRGIGYRFKDNLEEA